MQYVHEMQAVHKYNFDHFQHHSSTLLAVSLVDLRIVRSTPFGPFFSRDDGCGGVHQETVLSVGGSGQQRRPSINYLFRLCHHILIYLYIYLFFPIGIL